MNMLNIVVTLLVYVRTIYYYNLWPLCELKATKVAQEVNMRKLIAYICIMSVIILTCQTSFAAKKYKTVPTVIQTDPANNFMVETDKTITIKFSENILKGNTFSRIKLAVTLKPVNITVTIENNSLIIKTKERLDYDTDYVLTIPANAVKDTSGNGLKRAFVLKFRTQPHSSDFCVRVFQYDREIKAIEEGTSYLDRKAFSLRFSIPIEGVVQLAALDDSSYYDLAEVGTKLEDIPYFVPGSGMATAGVYDSMYILNEGHHYLFYSDDDDSRLTLIDEDENSIIDTSWNIDKLQLYDADTFEFTEYSFDELPQENIYLVAISDLNNNEIIDEGECIKLVLSFAN